MISASKKSMRAKTIYPTSKKDKPNNKSQKNKPSNISYMKPQKISTRLTQIFL
jgi:hypothetical protein